MLTAVICNKAEVRTFFLNPDQIDYPLHFHNHFCQTVKDFFLTRYYPVRQSTELEYDIIFIIQFLGLCTVLLKNAWDSLYWNDCYNKNQSNSSSSIYCSNVGMMLIWVKHGTPWVADNSMKKAGHNILLYKNYVKTIIQSMCLNMQVMQLEHTSCWELIPYHGRNHWGGRGSGPLQNLDRPPNFLHSFLMNRVWLCNRLHQTGYTCLIFSVEW